MVELSSYRLGDLIFLTLTENEKQRMVYEHPLSFGAQFILCHTNENNIEKITKIVMQKINTYRHLFPSNIEKSTVIHLRLGDVIAGNSDHEASKRPLLLEYYKKHINNNEIVYIIGRCFFASTSSRNYHECIEKSDKYLDVIKTGLNARHIDNNNADIDLCCAVLCKKFVQGRGYFSKLILEIRKKLNKYENIETIVATT